MDAIQFVKAQRRILEELLNVEWFSRSRKKQHPAHRRWALCNEILRLGGRVSFGNQEELAELVFDNFGVVQATQGKVDDFVLGKIANYGDENVQKRLRAVVDDPGQFLDVLFEINYAAWQIVHGHRIRAFECGGLPDFELFIEPSGLSVAADCKRIGAGTSDHRFRKLILKANKQIKKHGKEFPGLVVIDISAKLNKHDESGDTLLPQSDRICQIVEQSLQKHNRSVSGALITWRHTKVLPMTDGSRGSLCVLQRRSKLVRHTNPLHELPEDAGLQIGYDSMLALKILS